MRYWQSHLVCRDQGFVLHERRCTWECRASLCFVRGHNYIPVGFCRVRVRVPHEPGRRFVHTNPDDGKVSPNLSLLGRYSVRG